MSSGRQKNPIATYFGLQEIGESPVEQKLTEMKRRKTKHRIYTLLGVIGVGAMFVFSLRAVEFSLSELVSQWPEFIEALGEYFPTTTYFDLIPFLDVGQYWTFIIEENLFQATVVTVSIAFAGTVLGVVPALLLAIMSSERVVPYPFNFGFRAVMSVIRAIPALVWVLILIPLGGVGAFTATLAIAIDTVGYLGRLLTDELEEISDGPIEGIRSVGASKVQIVSFGMLSQVLREFIAWLAFDIEHNVRVAIGLGIIGAGGLGLELNIQRQTFNYTEMMACIFLMILLVGSVELMSQRVRSYLREGDEVETDGIITVFLNAPRKTIASITGRRE